MDWTNKAIARLLREVAAAHLLKGGNRFQIVAYENAADAIEHSTSEVKDLWEQKLLNVIPGIGEKLTEYLDELITTGHVKHFESVKHGFPEEMFPLLDIPGVGPKTALKLVEAGISSIIDLERRIQQEKLQSQGWSNKVCAKILRGIQTLKRRENRMLLSFANDIAVGIVEYLQKHSAVNRVDILGSLRRRVATVGDIDLAVASEKPKAVIDYFVKTPHSTLEEQGEKTATIILSNGVHIDLMVEDPRSYGSLLQYLTGSKQHNIHLRTLAGDKGYSISELGVKKVKTNEVIKCSTEDDVYHLLKMETPPPEMREDTGEIGAAQNRTLPNLLRLSDIKGDLHMHTTWSDGRESLTAMVKACEQLGYGYIAMTDHAYPSLDLHARHEEIEKARKETKMHILEGLEVNITADGKLQASNDVLKNMDFNIAAIHTGFDQSRETLTKRLLVAIHHPSIHAIAHPTGRLLLERESYDVDWETVFRACAKTGTLLEINAYPNRLDLPDTLVRQAKDLGVLFLINTDAHHSSHLLHMEYGVSVGRRGWLEAKDVVNTLNWAAFCGKVKKQ
ncbi:MAG: DNA polymerase/3'-5' exonuclease PolX [bacterium]|nr:DNA polymerase/3'-5' exonuclease PolX [bacterium]